MSMQIRPRPVALWAATLTIVTGIFIIGLNVWCPCQSKAQTNPAAAFPTSVVLRKNIDLLTDRELAAFEHAIQIMKDRSAANPYDKSGYLWQAWVHNCPLIWVPDSGSGDHGVHCDPVFGTAPPGYSAGHPGICEHGKDLFLPWHRAQFYYFEQILRATDPAGTVTDSRGVTGPSTAEVAVPFWNWTRPPSGVRYPKAVESLDSPLFHENRDPDPMTPEEREFFETHVTNPYAIAELVYRAAWPRFGGFPQESSVGGAGLFESRHHDIMHDGYFGSADDVSMRSPATAALDPAFFLFHAYIDLIYEFRLQSRGHGDVSSPRHFLRASQPDSVPPPPNHDQGAGSPNMGRVEIYFATAPLRYAYEVTPADRLPEPLAVERLLAAADGSPARFGATPQSPHARLLGGGLHDPAKGPPTMVASLAVPIAEPGENLRAAFTRPVEAPDLSYQVDFYLHPAGARLDLTDTAARERYVVTALGYWGRGDSAGHAGMHRPHKPMFAPLSAAVNDLAASGHDGETWILTAVVSGQPPAADFGRLTLLR